MSAFHPNLTLEKLLSYNPAFVACRSRLFLVVSWNAL